MSVGPMCKYRLMLLPVPARPQVGKMRTALKAVWPRLLWTTLYDREHVRQSGGRGLSYWRQGLS